MTTHTWSLALTCATLLAAPASASAHTFSPEREAVLQLDGRGAALLVRLVVRSGEAELLRLTHDLDHDGRLSAQEEARLAAVIGQRAVRGLEVRFAEARLSPVRIEPRLDALTRPGELAVVVLCDFVLPEAPARGELVLGLARGFGEVDAAVQALAPWSSQPAAARLAGGQALRVPVARGEARE